MSATHTQSEDFSAAFGPMLDNLAPALEPFVNRVTNDIYSTILREVETYLRSNAEWNIGSRLDRLAKAEEDRALLLIAARAFLAGLDSSGSLENWERCKANMRAAVEKVTGQ